METQKEHEAEHREEKHRQKIDEKEINEGSRGKKTLQIRFPMGPVIHEGNKVRRENKSRARGAYFTAGSIMKLRRLLQPPPYRTPEVPPHPALFEKLRSEP
jgi:hypothetical protein